MMGLGYSSILPRGSPRRRPQNALPTQQNKHDRHVNFSGISHCSSERREVASDYPDPISCWGLPIFLLEAFLLHKTR